MNELKPSENRDLNPRKIIRAAVGGLGATLIQAVQNNRDPEQMKLKIYTLL